MRVSPALILGQSVDSIPFDATKPEVKELASPTLLLLSASMVARPSSRRWLSYSLLACSLLGLCYWRLASHAGLPRNSKVTVVLSAYRTQGLRPQWIHDTAQLYTSKQFASVVDQVILVWNEPAAAPPNLPRAVRVIRGKVNSLNNR